MFIGEDSWGIRNSIEVGFYFVGVIVVDRRSDKQWLVSRRIIVIPLKQSITITHCCCWTMYKYWTRWEQWPLIGRSSNNCFPSLSAGWLVVCYQSWPLFSDRRHEKIFYCLCHDLSLKIKFGEWINGKTSQLHPCFFDRVMHSSKILLLHNVQWTLFTQDLHELFPARAGDL